MAERGARTKTEVDMFLDAAHKELWYLRDWWDEHPFRRPTGEARAYLKLLAARVQDVSRFFRHQD